MKKLSQKSFQELFQSPCDLYQGCGEQIVLRNKGKTSEPDFEQLLELENSGKYAAEPKFDGVWVAIFYDGKSLFVFSRNGKVEHVKLPSEYLAPQSILIGELCKGGYTLVNIFDVLMWDGASFFDYPYVIRTAVLTDIFTSELSFCNSFFRKVQSFLSGWVDLYKKQPEGIILKKLSSKYVGGYTKDFIKVKKWFTEDLVCMGWYPIQGKEKISLIVGVYKKCSKEEQLAKIEEFKKLGNTYITKKEDILMQEIKGKKYYLVPVCSVGGMSRKNCKRLSENFALYEGRVVEVQHWGYLDEGLLAHPSVFESAGDLGFRLDKDRRDCLQCI